MSERKEIPGFEGLYEILKDGRVYSVRRKIYLRPFVSGAGYPIVSLNKEGKAQPKLIHRLVAQAFIPNPENKPLVNHIDCDKKNYSIDNLEWVTVAENASHAAMNGLYAYTPAKKEQFARARRIWRAREEAGLINFMITVNAEMMQGLREYYFAECDKYGIDEEIRSKFPGD